MQGNGPFSAAQIAKKGLAIHLDNSYIVLQIITMEAMYEHSHIRANSR
jgi:hypothetical protein